MSPALIKLLFLVALLVIWKLFGKRIVAMFLVRSAAQGALKIIAALSPGQVAKLKVKRQGKDIDANITVGRRPKPQARPE